MWCGGGVVVVWWCVRTVRASMRSLKAARSLSCSLRNLSSSSSHCSATCSIICTILCGQPTVVHLHQRTLDRLATRPRAHTPTPALPPTASPPNAFLYNSQHKIRKSVKRITRVHKTPIPSLRWQCCYKTF